MSAIKIDMPTRKELQEAYIELKTIKNVADRYFVSTATIIRWVKHYKIPTTFEQRVSDYQFIRAYSSNISINELTKRWKCSKDIIWHRASKLKCRRRRGE